ncbi:ABC exporter membrane fusion protein, DevB family [Leptolyngbya sp. PCC 7375]|nr:ABC exporter membrane fusion protein, DevB family [Leptolyngbya sp. PCC 7375]
MRTFIEHIFNNNFTKPYRKQLTQQPKLWMIALLSMTMASALGAFLISRIGREDNVASQIALGALNDYVEPASVSALGFLKPEDEVTNLSGAVSPQGARIDHLLVSQGEHVKAGQIVAVLDNEARLKAALKKAKARVNIARSRLLQVEAGAKEGEINALAAKLENLDAELQGQIIVQKATIKRLEADLAGKTAAQEAVNDRISAEFINAEAECTRFEHLHAQGAISESEHALKCLEKEIAYKQEVESEATLTRIINSGQEQIVEAEAQLERTINTMRYQKAETQATLDQSSEVRDVDIALAQAELADAIVGVEQAKAELELAYVRVPRAGQVLKINTRPGEIITNQGILELGQTQQMYAIAEVYETDISRVHLGQKATITSDAIPYTLQGTVNEIGLQIGKQEVFSTNPAFDVDARVVEVKIRLNPEDSQKVSGLTNLRVETVIKTPG